MQRPGRPGNRRTAGGRTGFDDATSPGDPLDGGVPGRDLDDVPGRGRDGREQRPGAVPGRIHGVEGKRPSPGEAQQHGTRAEHRRGGPTSRLRNQAFLVRWIAGCV